jgi:hypothetical protein
MSTEDEKLLKEAKKLPWDERLQHKNWKVRNDANIDLAALCDSITDPKDARLREFGEISSRWLPIHAHCALGSAPCLILAVSSRFFFRGVF